MPGPSALPDLLCEIAFTPPAWASYLRAALTLKAGDPYHYVDLTSVSDYVVQSGDVLEFDVYWVGANQGVHFDVGGAGSAYLAGPPSGGVSLPPKDQNGIDLRGNVSAQANGQWYHRAIPITALSPGFVSGPDFTGVTLTLFSIVGRATGLGADTAFLGYLRDVVITDGAGQVRKRIWAQSDGPPPASSLVVTDTSPAGNSLALTKVAEPPVWTDVTPYFLEAHPRRGRNRELTKAEAGTMSLVLNNRDRRFDPANSASPYYPNVLPMRRVRLSATYGGTTYRRFTGYIERWPPRWQGRGSEVALDCVDEFEPLAIKSISGFRALEQSGSRVNWVLDLIGQPSADRAIDAGNSAVEQSGSSTGTLLDNAPALEHLLDIADAELGLFFISGAGTPTFQQRQKRIMAFSASQGVFSNAPGVGEFLYLDPELAFDKDDIFNEILVRPIAASSDQSAFDIDSQTEYGPRSLARTVWLTTTSEALNQAQALLARYREVSLRIDGIRLEPKRQDTLWPQALAREISDRVTIKWLPYGGGPTTTKEVHIEQISEDIVARDRQIDWSFNWALSPADVQAYWVLGDAANSLLGQSTILGY